MEKCKCGKNCYPKKIALVVKNNKLKEGKKLRVYQCQLCNWWHVTKKPYQP